MALKEKFENFESRDVNHEEKEDFQVLLKRKLNPLERKIEEMSLKEEEHLKAINSYKNKIRETDLQSQLFEITKDKINPKAFKDVMLRAKFDLEFDEEEGKFYSKDTNLDIKSWFEKESINSTWLPMSHGGGSTGNATNGREPNPFMKATWNATKQAMLRRSNPKEAERLQKLAMQ